MSDKAAKTDRQTCTHHGAKLTLSQQGMRRCVSVCERARASGLCSPPSRLSPLSSFSPLLVVRKRRALLEEHGLCGDQTAPSRGRHADVSLMSTFTLPVSLSHQRARLLRSTVLLVKQWEGYGAQAYMAENGHHHQPVSEHCCQVSLTALDKAHYSDPTSSPRQGPDSTIPTGHATRTTGHATPIHHATFHTEAQTMQSRLLVKQLERVNETYREHSLPICFRVDRLFLLCSTQRILLFSSHYFFFLSLFLSPLLKFSHAELASLPRYTESSRHSPPFLHSPSLLVARRRQCKQHGFAGPRKLPLSDPGSRVSPTLSFPINFCLSFY